MRGAFPYGVDEQGLVVDAEVQQHIKHFVNTQIKVMQENFKRILKPQSLANEVCLCINLATYINAEKLRRS